MRRTILATLLSAPLSFALACGDEATPAPAAPADGDASSSSSSTSSSSSSSSSGEPFGDSGVACKTLSLPAAKAPRVTVAEKTPQLQSANIQFDYGTYESYALRLYDVDASASSEPDVWRGTMAVDGFGGVSFATEQDGKLTTATYRFVVDKSGKNALELVCSSDSAAPATIPARIYRLATLNPAGNGFITEYATGFAADEPYLRVYRKVP